MNPATALVIDDNTDILEDVCERLTALGHACDSVQTMADARTALGSRTYSYVLLDLEIPVAFGRPSRLENGLAMLAEITSRPHAPPVIVMTGHGHDSSDLAADVISTGHPLDYIRKPFPRPGSGARTLEQAVRRAAEVAQGGSGDHRAVRPLQTALVVLEADCVTVAGVRVAGPTGETLIRRILDLLAMGSPSGQHRRMTGGELAEALGEQGLETSVAVVSGAIRDFRKLVIEVLLQEAGMACTDQSVIESGGSGHSGYRFARGLEIHVERAAIVASANGRSAPAPAPARSRGRTAMAARQP